MTSRKHEGFRVEQRTATIDFAEESPWHGVEAKVITSVPFETLFWFQRNAENTDAETTVEALRKFGDLYLMEWNVLDPAGNPYPASGDGVTQVGDSTLIQSLMVGWIDAVVHPPAPLSARYTSSQQSEDSLIAQLANSSQSLGN
jgi:hypothetical protein